MIKSKMRPFSAFPAVELQAIRFVLTDIDDTLTHSGMLPSSSLRAIEDLAEAGVKVIPVTGRPAGWCDHIARMWSVSAVVGENGALYFSYDRARKRMKTCFTKEDPERQRDREELAKLARIVLARVPGTALATDQDYRVSDLAIDFCEDVEPLSMDQVAEIVRILRDGGATTKVSSIHVNAWFGKHDKLTTSRACLADLFGINSDTENDSIIFVGDSPNDEPMFAYFNQSIGVANVRQFPLEHEPAWITSGHSAEGFVEVARAILSAKTTPYHHAP